MLDAGSLRPGEVLGDRYVLKKTEWSSPLGPVWLARDRVLDRAVFVQVLAPAIAGNLTARRAFHKEAARVAQVAHPGLLQIYDIGDEPAFVVFEHAAGGRLADRLRSGPMRPAEAARAALSLARGLEALHERGTWHSSLSPAGVVFDEEGRAKVFAAGVAQVARAAEEIGHDPDQPAGYRPDDLDSLPADDDRYALAALTFHMVTGKAPQKGAASARALRRSIPAAIDGLLARALSDQPAERPSLDEFVAALAPFARIEPPDAREPRIRASELRWLLPVVLIVGLAVAALTVGVQVARDLAGRPANETTPTETTPRTRPLAVKEVFDFDPEGNRSERPEKVGLAIDGDARSAWETVGYRTATLSGEKSGVGLIFDLGTVEEIGLVRVQSTRPGWTAEIRVADTEATTVAGFRRVTSFTAGNESNVRLPAGTKARYFLLWITRLVDDEGGSEFPFRAAIAEAEFFRR